jgi:2-oxoglutarate ferredoxin oxidoreductase subunit beta
MLHDGSWVRLRKLAADYNPTDRDAAYAYIRERQRAREVVTGLLYLSSDSKDMHEQAETVPQPMVELPFERLCPGNAELQKLQERFR